MNLATKLTRRLHSFRLSIRAVAEEARTEAQQAAIQDLLQTIEHQQRMIDASPSLRDPVGQPSRSLFNFAGMIYQGDFFDVPASRTKALRVAASAWGKAHGVKLSVSKLPGDLGARCTRMDGPMDPDGDTF